MEDLGGFFKNLKGKPGRPRSKTKTKKGNPRKGSPDEAAEKFNAAREAQEAALRDMEKDPTLRQMVRDKVLNRISRNENRIKDMRLQDILEAGKERDKNIAQVTPVEYSGMRYYRFPDGAQYILRPGMSGAQFLRKQWIIIKLK